MELHKKSMEEKSVEAEQGGETPLIRAAEAGNVELCTQLLDAGSVTTASSNFGWNSLHYAAGKGHLEVCKTLIKYEIPLDEKTRDGYSALVYAAWHGHRDVVTLLVESGAVVESGVESMWEALHFAVREGHVTVCQYLLDHGADVNKEVGKNLDGWLPIHLAARYDHIEIAELLISKGTDLSFTDFDGRTGLHWAAWRSKNSAFCPLFLQNGVGVDCLTKASKTPLMHATESGNLDMVMTLQSAGANLCLVDKTGQTILHFAAAGGHVSIATFFLENHAAECLGIVNTPDVNGTTPLHLASSRGHAVMVKFLIEVGDGDTKAINGEGKTVLQLARDLQRKDVVDVLLTLEVLSVEERASVEAAAAAAASAGGGTSSTAQTGQGSIEMAEITEKTRELLTRWVVIATAVDGTRGWYTMMISEIGGSICNFFCETEALRGKPIASMYALQVSVAVLANDIHGEPRLDALRSEFGAYGTVELADWNDIKDCVSVVGLRGLMNNVLGWSEPRGGPKVTCNGQQYWIDPENNAKRGYYVSFYHGGVPSWYLAHDKIEDGFDYLALGSWHNELPVLAKVQLKMFSSAQSGVAEDVPLIPWSQLYTDTLNGKIGQGAYGAVFRAMWMPKHPSLMGSKAVAVKIMTRSAAAVGDLKYEEELQRSYDEAKRTVQIRKSGGPSLADLVIEVFGFAQGPLPPSLISVEAGIPVGEEGFGVVMRLEHGGSIEHLLHPPPDCMVVRPLELVDKLRLLVQISRAIAELHGIGYVHGDLKPANILLDTSTPPSVRVADFGLSEFRKNSIERTMGQSTMQKTKATKGTPVYCAPEMFEEDDDGDVANASRSTDLYAFGMIAWEILARQRPFANVTNVVTLGMKVCRGGRPSIDDKTMPSGTPPSLTNMIHCCWDGDRIKRLSAVECWATIQHNLNIMEKEEFDIFFSHRWKKKPFLSHLFNLLTKSGYRVWYDQNNMSHDLATSMQKGIDASKLTLVCVDEGYQTSTNCMYELKHARKIDEPLQAPKPTLTLVIEENPFYWMNPELQDLCELKNKLFVDMSVLAADVGWQDAPSESLLLELRKASEALIKLLGELNCLPSMKTTTARSK